MKVFALRRTLLLATLATLASGAAAQNDTMEELNWLVVNGMFTGVVNQLAVLTESQRSEVFEAVPDAIRNVMEYLCNSLEDGEELSTCSSLWSEVATAEDGTKRGPNKALKAKMERRKKMKKFLKGKKRVAPHKNGVKKANKVDKKGVTNKPNKPTKN